MGKYTVEKFETYLEVLDSNALQIYHPSGDFIVTICTYLEDDDELDAPQFTRGAIGEPIDGDRIDGDIESVTIGARSLEFDFSRPFKNGEQNFEFEFSEPINSALIDFLVNKLSLGGYVRYKDDVDESLRIEQSEFREVL